MEMARAGEELVSGLFLVVREGLIERPEGGEEALGLLRAHLVEARAQLQALHRGLRFVAVAAWAMASLMTGALKPTVPATRAAMAKGRAALRGFIEGYSGKGELY